MRYDIDLKMFCHRTWTDSVAVIIVGQKTFLFFSPYFHFCRFPRLCRYYIHIYLGCKSTSYEKRKSTINIRLLDIRTATKYFIFLVVTANFYVRILLYHTCVIYTKFS